MSLLHPALPLRVLAVGAAFAAVVFASACDLDLTVDDGAVIRCDVNEHCPDPLLCATRIQRCVTTAQLDAPAIAIERAELSRSRLGTTAAFNTGVLELVTSIAPVTLEVRFDVGDDPVELTCTTSGDDRRTWSCLYALDPATSSSDAAGSIVAVATDALGTAATVTRVVTLDVTAPRLLETSPTARYLPTLDNPRAVDGVIAARAGTTVEVGFGWDEPCATIPVAALRLRSALDDDSNDLSLEARTGTSAPALLFFMQRTITDSDSDGDYDVVASCVDDVGNSRTVRFAVDVVVDQTPPAPAPVEVLAAVDGDDDDDDDDAVVLVRTPWGVGGAGFASLHGRLDDDGEQARRVDVYGPTLVGSGVVVDGRFEIPLLVGDARIVDVVVVDGAGNISERVQVKNVELLATLGGKVVASTFENPHTMLVTPELAQDLDDPLLREVDGAASVAADDETMTVTAALRWREVSAGSADRPEPRVNAAAGFDPARGELIVLGGFMNTPIDQTVQLHDGNRWRTGERLPDQVNGALIGAFDVRRNVFVVVTAENLTFERGPGGWRQRDVLPVAPSPRRENVIAWDPIAGATIWNGFDGQGNATWAWDGQGWRVYATGGPQGTVTMAFDSSLGGLVAFVVNGSATSETWLLADGVWTDLQPAPRPTATLGVLTTDVVGGGVILLQSRSPFDAGAPVEMWRFVDGDWSPVTLLGDAPTAAIRPIWVANTITGDIFLLDGGPFQTVGTRVPIVVQARVFDGVRWHQPRAFTPLGALFDAGAADDGNRGVVLFGGVFDDGALAPNGDTFTFTGTDWVGHAFNNDGIRMPNPNSLAMARRAGEVVLIDQGKTWIWNSRSATWNIRSTRTTPAVIRPEHTTLDQTHTLLVGAGPNRNQTFIYDGLSWRLVCDPARGELCPVLTGFSNNATALAGLRDGVVAFVDATTRQTMLFINEVWTIVDDETPSFGGVVAMGRHRQRGTAVVYSGIDTWELSCPEPCTAASARWHELVVSRHPQARRSHAVVSFGDDAVLLVGGSVAGDTWTLDTGSDIRPAAIARFSLDAAGVDGTIRGLQLDAEIVASGPGGTGAVVRSWQDGHFVDVAGVNVAAGTQTTVTWSTTTAATIASVAFGAQREVVVALTTAGGGVVDGTATALDVDALSLRIRYRLAP